jgi:hypothetical protein
MGLGSFGKNILDESVPNRHTGGGVTGRCLILKAAEGCFISAQDAERIATEIEALGYVCVPKQPTPEMIAAAWADALGEDAAAVWKDMIDEADGLTVPEEEIRKEAERLYPHVS